MAQNVDIELVIKAGQSAQTLGEIKQSIKDVTEALKNVKTGTAEFERLKEVFQQNRANVKAMRQEFADLKQIEGVGKILTGSFAAATASMSLFTGESERAEKAIRKVEAAFVLMESVQKIAHAFREAAIANETFNKSLLTNPYMLIAVAIAAVAVGIYTFANDTEYAQEQLKKLDEMNLEHLKESLSELSNQQKDRIDDLKNELELLKIKKASEEEIYAKQSEINQQVKADAEEGLKKITESDKIRIANAEQEQREYDELLKKLNENIAYIEFKNKQKEAGADIDYGELNVSKDIVESLQKQLPLLGEQLKRTKEIVKSQDELKGKIQEANREQARNDAEKQQKAIEEQRREIHDQIIERIKAEKKAEDDYEKSLQNGLELLTAYGAKEKEQSDFKLAMLGDEIGQESKLAEKQKTKTAKALAELKKYGDKTSEQYKAAKTNYDAEKEALDETIKKRDDLIQKKKVEVEVNKQLAKGEKSDADLKLIEQYDKAYDEQAAKLKNVIDVMKAKEAEEKEVFRLSIEYNNLLINSIRNEIAAVNDSAISDDAKKKKVDELIKKIQDLTRENNVLAASLTKSSKNPFFSDKQLKDVEKAVKYAKEAEQTIGKFTSAVTQMVDQNVQRRIAMYQHENDMYTSGLQNALNEGFISQQTFNKKKAEADKELAKKKAEENHKAFVAHKATSIVTATINTALAVVNALATAPSFIAGIVFAALAGAAGAVEIGTIAAAKEPPAYAVGGTVEGVGTSTSDSITAKLSNGESVMNAKSTAAFKPLLSAINQAGGGVALKGTPSLQKSPTGAISSPQPQASSVPQKVVVSEYDITRTQRKVAVAQSRSTF